MGLIKKIFNPRQINALGRAIDAIKALRSSDTIAKTISLIMIIVELFGFVLFDLPQTPRGQQLNLDDYYIVFEDEFDGAALDLTKWEYRANGARRGGFNAPSQVRVEDGNLKITAEYLTDGGYGEGWYTGMIRTIEEYTTGYFEVSCICSKGGGFWSAYWLNSTGMASEELSNGGIGGAEIDIFEAFNYDKALGQDSVSLNVHVGGYGDGLESLRMGNYYGSGIYTQYNTYGLEWTEDEYIFYINGVEADRTSFADGVSQAPEYAILSLEMPSEITEQPGFSTEFIVDYVRIYQTGVSV
jgi:beta-glucanase (GH16 family)